MSAPLLREIVKSLDLERYFLLLALIFMFFLPQLANWFSILNKQTLASTMNVVIGHIGCYFNCTSYFLLGHYLNRTEISQKATGILYFLGICCFVAVIPLSVWLSIRQQEPTQFFIDVSAPNNFLGSAAVFLFAKRHWNFPNISKKAEQILHILSKYSFGAYLVHALLVDHFSLFFGIDVLSFCPWLSIPTISVIVFLISFAISAVINQIPVLRSYIV